MADLVNSLSIPPAAAVVETVRVLVGPDQQEFTVNRKLLRASSPYFRDSLDAVPAALSSSPGGGGGDDTPPPEVEDRSDLAIWLTSECPRMFGLFARWLHNPPGFRSTVDELVAASQPRSSRRSMSLHWTLIKLHLFAASLSLASLQDASLDALQDLYLAHDWDVSPRLLRYLYGGSPTVAPEATRRLRVWAVAMLAWGLANGAADDDVASLFAAYPDLRADYDAHIARMAGARADVRVKNPQLRIARNRLRSEERAFGFRQCSFHSHRREVGEGRCPLVSGGAAARGLDADDDDVASPLTPASEAGSVGSGLGVGVGVLGLMSPLKVVFPVHLSGVD